MTEMSSMRNCRLQKTLSPTKQEKIGKLLLKFCMVIPPLSKMKGFELKFVLQPQTSGGGIAAYLQVEQKRLNFKN